MADVLRRATLAQVVAQFQQKSWRRIGGQELNIDNATIGKRGSVRFSTSRMYLLPRLLSTFSWGGQMGCGRRTIARSL
jgi:hypothetical protein